MIGPFLPTDFYPRSPRGERQNNIKQLTCWYNDFYPRSPRGERLLWDHWENLMGQFLSTLPARGATLAFRLAFLLGHISIHAPREGSDFCMIGCCRFSSHFYPRSPRGERHRYFFVVVSQCNISIHAPREGSDVLTSFCDSIIPQFLSTLPARGATRTKLFSFPSLYNFYPRSPRGERHGHTYKNRKHFCISIHAPREGSDGDEQSLKKQLKISIHAPREGSDGKMHDYFTSCLPFLSTLPARGATPVGKPAGRKFRNNFYPRSPRGERHQRKAV